MLVGLVRSAVYRAVLSQSERHPDEPLTDEDLGRRVLSASGRPGRLRPQPDVEYAARDKTVRALRESVAYRVWARSSSEAGGSPCPNLEQTGQLRLTYAGVDELAADEPKWAGARPATRRGRPRNAQAGHARLLD